MVDHFTNSKSGRNLSRAIILNFHHLPNPNVWIRPWWYFGRGVKSKTDYGDIGPFIQAVFEMMNEGGDK